MHRIAALAIALLTSLAPAPAQAPADDWAAELDREAQTLGKPAWRAMLASDIALHRADTHPATPPFAYPWEDTGRGYGYGPGFGHWDLVHEILDVLPAAPEHAREQLLNDIHLQLPSGFLPGLYWMRQQTAADNPAIYERSPVDKAAARFSPTQSHPPLWVVAADDFLEQDAKRTGRYDKALAAEFLHAAKLQIGWFEGERHAKPGGFLYLDVVEHKWESGIDEGVRFDGLGPGASMPASTACIDATAHVYQMNVYAAKWEQRLHQDSYVSMHKAAVLAQFMRQRMWSERDGMFYDSWVLDRAPDGPRDTWHGTIAPGRAHPFEGMWPIVGAASPHQAARLTKDWLLRPDRFYTVHPIATVAASDPQFSTRMWRGPVWNSMTYWAARGAMRYGYPLAARRLLEPALDDTAAQFARTGLLWEFYSPSGGHPEDLTRKPQTKRNQPFTDYLGHNPLLAMARLWRSTF